jgi:predicted HicB family RNase H-like nuclease
MWQGVGSVGVNAHLAATIEAAPEAGIFHGEVINICDVLTFQGRSLDELTQAFRGHRRRL